MSTSPRRLTAAVACAACAIVAAALFSAQQSASATCQTDTTKADFQAGVATNVDIGISPGDVVLLKGAVDQQQTVATTSGTGFNTTQ